MNRSERDRVLREVANRTSAEMRADPDRIAERHGVDCDPDAVLASLREAVDAGLLKVTRRGVRATIPRHLR